MSSRLYSFVCCVLFKLFECFIALRLLLHFCLVFRQNGVTRQRKFAISKISLFGCKNKSSICVLLRGLMVNCFWSTFRSQSIVGDQTPRHRRTGRSPSEHLRTGRCRWTTTTPLGIEHRSRTKIQHQSYLSTFSRFSAFRLSSGTDVESGDSKSDSFHPLLPHFRYAKQFIGQKLSSRWSTRGANCILFEDTALRSVVYCRPDYVPADSSGGRGMNDPYS